MEKESVKVAVNIFNETAKIFDTIHDDKLVITGLHRGEAFALVYEQACIIYRTMYIQQEREKEHKHSEDKKSITDKQANYLKYLAVHNSKANDIIAEYIDKLGAESIYDLTTKEASELIEKIKGVKE